MARLTKTQQFAIYEDTNAIANTTAVDGDGSIPTPDSTRHEDQDPMSASQKHPTQDEDLYHTHFGHANEDDLPGEAEEDVISTYIAEQHGHGDADADDERRQSAFTSTSISSLPESAFETDYEAGMMHKPYAPPSMRPTFRRPESVRRMQMSSPTPSLRSSILSPARARITGSARSSGRGSPKPKRHAEFNAEEDMKHFPLVLLHITLLPVELPWSRDSMREILPSSTLEDLQLLRSKASETVSHRGILIPHPQEEYELLEERLLEALELKKERITKCGHFRARESTGAISVSSADSGVELSVQSSDTEVCETCRHPFKMASSAVCAGGKNWSIKVFAANGLMRAPAWSAGWTEMERVDVEILPWIEEDLRKKLDARRDEEIAERRSRQQDEQAKTSGLRERHIQVGEEPISRCAEPHIQPDSPEPSVDTHSPMAGHVSNHLPQVYQPKDIPLSLLLRNYIFLLAQDKRNVAIFALSALALWLSLRVAVMPSGVEMGGNQPVLARHRSQYDIPLVPELDQPVTYTPVSQDENEAGDGILDVQRPAPAQEHGLTSPTTANLMAVDAPYLSELAEEKPKLPPTSGCPHAKSSESESAAPQATTPEMKTAEIEFTPYEAHPSRIFGTHNQ